MVRAGEGVRRGEERECVSGGVMQCGRGWGRSVEGGRFGEDDWAGLGGSLRVSAVGGELVPGHQLVPLSCQADVPRHEVQPNLEAMYRQLL